MDRISNLSDDLLLKILSELPTKDVVATMLLSKRWKLLWTMVTKLDFDDSVKEYIGKNAVPYRKFQEYIDRFLVSHKSPVLETSKFNLGCCLPNTDDMSTWIRFAIARRVRKLEVNRCLEVRFMSIIVPMCLYTFEKLVALKLCGSILLFVDQKDQVCLSSLKSLHLLRVQHVYKTYLDRLLAGCPVLEELVLDIRKLHPVPSLHVIMPTLQRLSILKKHHEQDSVEYTNVLNRKIVINVPSLKYLNYEDTYDYGHSCSSENMT
ncbi:PREDICTED: putative FBD-associated F-box protein At3g50710 [Camelina sativa]|uniref:FBD-associated F-box protein At3g50710 n=1 Tax=Camelina sativa TaxID=90675 RepID=A0ABM1R9W5_CAMSA|nr:PREDICTED: putative FBD-associated F-box protein At3g50710 [Camelina sativa]